MVRLIECNACKNNVSSLAESCPNCGHPISGSRKKSKQGSSCGGFLGYSILIIVGIVILARIFEEDAYVEKPENAIGERYSIANLNLRDGPSTDYEVLETLEVGDRVYVIDSENDWLKVRPRQRNFEEGWIYGQYTAEYSADEYEQFMAGWHEEQRRLEEHRRAQEQEATEPTRDELIQRQFSIWDGRHRQLKRIVDSHLNDPNSFELIETRYSDRGEYIYVVMDYTAKNRFGGRVRAQAIADFSLDGELIELYQVE